MKDFLFPTPVVVTGPIEKDRPVNLTGMIGIRLQIPGRVLMCPRKQVKVHGPFRLSEKSGLRPASTSPQISSANLSSSLS